jgi:hypothetical protein
MSLGRSIRPRRAVARSPFDSLVHLSVLLSLRPLVHDIMSRHRLLLEVLYFFIPHVSVWELLSKERVIH